MYLSIVPSTKYLIEYTYMHPTVFFPLGNSHFSHVSFLSKADFSFSIAFFHLGSLIASSKFLGTSLEEREALKATTLCERSLYREL